MYVASPLCFRVVFLGTQVEWNCSTVPLHLQNLKTACFILSVPARHIQGIPGPTAIDKDYTKFIQLGSHRPTIAAVREGHLTRLAIC